MPEQAMISFQGNEYIDCTPVEPGHECPSCNENRKDRLIWRGDWVVCSTGGYGHNPGKEQLMDEMDQSGVYPV